MTYCLPTYEQVMRNCTVGGTRKKLWEAYANRGYPANDAVLKEIIRIRDQYAKLLGYPSYAELDISTEMAEKPEKVEAFLTDLQTKAQSKGEQEIAKILSDLPAGITLTAGGKIKPWDIGYVGKQYVMKHFDLDDNKVAEYFPVPSTFTGLLDIYEKFMGVRFTILPIDGLWDKDVMLLEVKTNDNKLIGYLLLDLFPRPHKYTHACQITLYQATKNKNGIIDPGLCIVIANFPKPIGDKPALLKHSDVKTFFHEFGHAVHALLGANELAMQSGTNVKTDFVELPSQMLEEWMYDRDVLKKLSKHYKTGEPLPDKMIATIVDLKNFTAADTVRRQIGYSILSLDCHREGTEKDFHGLFKKIQHTTQPHLEHQETDHFVCSFGHLTGYGSKYYSYMWSKVFALDLFDYIKRHGLTNPAVGKRYVDKILVKGGTAHPYTLLTDFLERTPSSEAFFKSMGFGYDDIGLDQKSKTSGGQGEHPSVVRDK